MKTESLKLTGCVVKVNAADQSFLLESRQSVNRRWVYADNELFKKLDHILTTARFNGEKAKEQTGIFYIQGKVLVGFFLENHIHEWAKVFKAAFREYFANPKEFLAK
jgi:hypothetical protein